MTTPLFTGAPLTAELFNEFIERLRHDCVGAGVSEHHTADVIFLVEQQDFIYGIDTDYAPHLAVFCGESYYHSISEFMAIYRDSHQGLLDDLCRQLHDKLFDAVDEPAQFEAIGELEGFTLIGYQEHWTLVNFHFTQSSADHFVLKHGHKYDGALRICQESQDRSFEFNAIKNALLNGNLVWRD